MFRHIVAGLYVAVFFTPAYAFAADAAAPVEAVAPAKITSLTPAVAEELRKIITSRVTTISLNAQNKRYAGIDQAEIDKLDKQWRAETKNASQPLIAQLMGNPLSSYLIRMKAQSLGLFTEIFVFDAKGLNVGQSSVTSDYWQGDEPKYQETFAKGPDAILIDEPEYDDETKSMRQQVSFAIIDPDTKELIGAATVEINVDELARRGALPQS